MESHHSAMLLSSIDSAFGEMLPGMKKAIKETLPVRIDCFRYPLLCFL